MSKPKLVEAYDALFSGEIEMDNISCATVELLAELEELDYTQIPDHISCAVSCETNRDVVANLECVIEDAAAILSVAKAALKSALKRSK